MTTTPNTTTASNPNKPFTSNFQLQTKIRVIIQQVLSATIRKYFFPLPSLYRLSIFNQKIDKFQDYFMVFKQKIQTIQKSTEQNKQSIKTQFDQRIKLKKQFTNQIIKSEQTQQKNHIQFDQLNNKIMQIDKQIKQILRQNENLNSELSKTKGKFLQYSNVISALKQQVSWKITKYIQETAQTNTQIKINNENMKKQYFNINLVLEKQKEKYDKIIEMNQAHQNNTKKIMEDIQGLRECNKEREGEIKKNLEKIDQYDTILQSKIKTLDNKCDGRITRLQEDNKKSMNAVKKLETFNQQLQELKSEQQKNRLQFIKRLQQSMKKTKDQAQVQNVKLSKQLLKVQKNTQKKINQLKQSSQKSQDFLTQKIQFIKMQIQNQISSHTNQLLQEKQNSSKVNSSTMEEINSKLNKFNMDVHKNITKLENNIKQIRSEVKKDIDNFKENIQTKLQTIEANPRKNSQEDSGTSKKISAQLLKQFQQFSQKITSIQERLAIKDQQILQIKQNQHKAQIFQKQMVKKIDTYFKTQQQEISNKVQKIMFLVTKMRGDNIIRNQFTQKEIKEIKRNHSEYKDYTDTILKLIPAFGECINLILSLIYDAEYQHSKIIQDNLPVLKKDEEKFNTCVEGVLYEFKQKKKAGVICYRHKDIRKTEIVKATFNAYINLWEDLFENQFKNKLQYFPKTFYKKSVEKVVNNKVTPGGQKNQKRQASSSVSPNKQSNFYENLISSVGFSKNSQPFNHASNKSRQLTSQRQKQQSLQHKNLNISQSQSIYNSHSLNNIASRQAAKSLKKIQEEEIIKQIKQSQRDRQGTNSGSSNNIENGLNNSFHIRKKKTVRKEQVVVLKFPENLEK